jgi:hypothetical protein
MYSQAAQPNGSKSPIRKQTSLKQHFNHRDPKWSWTDWGAPALYTCCYTPPRPSPVSTHTLQSCSAHFQNTPHLIIQHPRRMGWDNMHGKVGTSSLKHAHLSQNRHFETGTLRQDLLDRKIRVTGTSGRNF